MEVQFNKYWETMQDFASVTQIWDPHYKTALIEFLIMEETGSEAASENIKQTKKILYNWFASYTHNTHNSSQCSTLHSAEASFLLLNVIYTCKSPQLRLTLPMLCCLISSLGGRRIASAFGHLLAWQRASWWSQWHQSHPNSLFQQVAEFSAISKANLTLIKLSKCKYLLRIGSKTDLMMCMIHQTAFRLAPVPFLNFLSAILPSATASKFTK